jgi:hypothetical protein
MMHRLCFGLAAAIFVAPVLHAQELPTLAVTVDVRHVAKDAWRVDYRFSQPVTAVKLYTVGDYRQQAWTPRTPGLRMVTDAGRDVLSAQGKAFTRASVDVKTHDALVQKAYAPFNRFSDGGVAVFLGHFQGDVQRANKDYSMQTDIRLTGLARENVIAPPPNRRVAGGERGYAYFGPAQAVLLGKTQFLIDPQTPPWAREVLLDAGAKTAQYYEKAYQRTPKDDLFIMVSAPGFTNPGMSMTGGAVLGQLSYRLEGQQMLGDHPKKRDMLAKIVAHEMAHLWQMSGERGGIGESDPWIHEGGAEVMALDGLLQSGLWDEKKVGEYRTAQTAKCDKLDNSVASYDGIYACGLVRFDKLGVGIVPLWRSMIAKGETSGDVFSQKMIDTIVAGSGQAGQGTQ